MGFDHFFGYVNVPHANNEAGNMGMEVPDLGKFASKDWPEPEKGFAAMIRNIDRDAGRILDLLRELKIDKNTLVIFTSDNGPHQEGGHKADTFDSNGKLRGIKRDLTEGGIRVPTIAWWPGVVKPGTPRTCWTRRTSRTRTGESPRLVKRSPGRPQKIDPAAQRRRSEFRKRSLTNPLDAYASLRARNHNSAFKNRLRVPLR